MYCFKWVDVIHAGVNGMPQTGTQPVTEPLPAAVSAKSRPRTRTPSSMLVTEGALPRIELPMAVGAEVMEETGPNPPRTFCRWGIFLLTELDLVCFCCFVCEVFFLLLLLLF